MKTLSVILLFLMASLTGVGQMAFPPLDNRPQAYNFYKIGKFIWIATNDTVGVSASYYPGAIVFRQQPGDTSHYFSTGGKWEKLGSIDTTSLSNRINAKVGTAQLTDSLNTLNLERVTTTGSTANIMSRDLILDAGSGKGFLRFTTDNASYNRMYSMTTNGGAYRPFLYQGGGFLVSNYNGGAFTWDGSSALQVNGIGKADTLIGTAGLGVGTDWRMVVAGSSWQLKHNPTGNVPLATFGSSGIGVDGGIILDNGNFSMGMGGTLSPRYFELTNFVNTNQLGNTTNHLLSYDPVSSRVKYFPTDSLLKASGKSYQPVNEARITPSSSNPTLVDGGEADMIMQEDSVTVDQWYRLVGDSVIRYRTADNDLLDNWSAPTVCTGLKGLFPTTFKVGSTYYMFLRKDVAMNDIYLYSSTNKTSWSVMNGGSPVILRSGTSTDWNKNLYNVGVAVEGTKLHILVEGHADDGYYSNTSWMGYASADLSNPVFTLPAKPQFQGSCGSFAYVPERNALVGLYSELVTKFAYDSIELRGIKVSLSSNLQDSTSWVKSTVRFNNLGKLIADASFVFTPGKTNPMLLFYNYNQASGFQGYANLNSVTQLYESLYTTGGASQKVEFRDVTIGGNIGVNGAPAKSENPLTVKASLDYAATGVAVQASAASSFGSQPAFTFYDYLGVKKWAIFYDNSSDILAFHNGTAISYSINRSTNKVTFGQRPIAPGLDLTSHLGITSTNGDWAFGTDDGGNGTASNQFFIYNNTDAQYRFALQRGTGNVGISTSSPTERLHVNGNAKITGTLEVGGVKWISGTGSPEGSVTAPAGSIYSNTSGGAGTTLYVKESGSGNTGWIAK